MHARLRRLIRLTPALALALILAACGAATSPPAPASTSLNSAAASGAPTSLSNGAGAAQPVAAEQAAAPAADLAGAPAPLPSGAGALQPTAAAETTSEQAITAPAPTAAAAYPADAPLPTPTMQPVEPNPMVRTVDDHLSTFAMDVDTASYTAARNYLTAGQLPPPDSVRVEEFVNYFRYNYPAPQQDAFGISVDAAPSPSSQRGTQIVRVGIQGRRIDAGQRADAMLTFVIDASGSMDQPNRLPLVKQSLHALVDELRQGDQVAIVVFGSESHIVLDPTSVAQRDAILAAIDSLQIEGATNIEDGLRMAYKLAADHFKPGMINRVILCSDGEANIGATGPDSILNTIRDYKAQGVLLSTVGFGLGNYNDHMMERLADAGNGNYAFVDTLDAARRIFVENLTGTLQVIARDAKIQVDFNPAVVSSYRLLGYENRNVADADFRNDKVDAGEVGAGHSVTALYEVNLTGQGDGTALTVQVRYADPQTGKVHEIRQMLARAAFGHDLSAAPADFRLALAAARFAEVLRSGGSTQDHALSDVHALAQDAAAQRPNDQDAQELVRLIERARQLGG